MPQEIKPVAHGGKRPGAGRKRASPDHQRKPLPKTNKRTQVALAALESGITPLDVMLTTMRNAWMEGNLDLACFMAEKAAPYVHPKLAAVEHSGNKDKPLSHVVEYLDALDGLARRGLAAGATDGIIGEAEVETESPLPH